MKKNDPRLSCKLENISESITLKLNSKAVELEESGGDVYNLTAGQLPFRTMPEFVDALKQELNFIKSYQYGPVLGNPKYRKKVIEYTEKTRNIDFSKRDQEFDCAVSNGAKHTLSNIFGTILNLGDEVVLISPCWISYPEIIKLWGGVPINVRGHGHGTFTPVIYDVRKVVTPNTKAIIINSPNNPVGTYYSKEWMEELADLLVEFPNLIIVSDEIYFKLNYFDPQPTYFYQYRPELLDRTVIVDGISKSFACTGLRIGYCIGPKWIIDGISKLQGHTTAGPNSLVQNALANFDFDHLDNYLNPIKIHLRRNAVLLQEKFRASTLSQCWYQSTSAFYFLINLTLTPVFSKYKKNENDENDYAKQICMDLLEATGVVVVPGSDFYAHNCCRLSLVLEQERFTEALDRLTKFLTVV